MGLEDWELALIIVGAVIGTIVLTNLAFYSAFGHLPHWFRNLFLRFPPVLSCDAIDERDKEKHFDHTRVTGRLVWVACVPLCLTVILLIVAFYEDAPELAVSSSDKIKSAAQCAMAIAEEQVLAVSRAGTGTWAGEARWIHMYDGVKPTTDLNCGRGEFDSALATLAAARAAAANGDFRGTIYNYAACQRVVRKWASDAMFEALSGVENNIVGEMTGSLTANAVSEECGTLSSTTGSLETCASTDCQYPARLNAPSGYMLLHNARNVFNRTTPMFDHAATEAGKDDSYNYLSGLDMYRNDAILNELRHRAEDSVHVLQTPAMTTDELHSGATNMTNMLAEVRKHAIQRNEHELTTSYDEMKKNRDVVIGLCAFGMIICVAAIALNILYIRTHQNNMEATIIIRQDFKHADQNKQLFAEFHNHYDSLQVEKFEEKMEGNSKVEKAFWELGKVLLHLKPFLNHSLFEGDLEDDDHLSVEDFEFAAGRTAQYPVKLEVGMHFCNCSVMVVCTEMFNDLQKNWLNEKREDIVADYNEFIRIVTEATSFYGGVVHHIGSGSLICTWNCSLSCDNPATRAVEAAFKLDSDFTEANQEDDKGSFSFIPGDESLQISVCSGGVVAGNLKKTSGEKCHILIGPPPLVAEHLVHMCPYMSVPVLVDKNTQLKVRERWMTRPVYCFSIGTADAKTKRTEQVVYEVQADVRPTNDERTKHYSRAFNFFRLSRTEPVDNLDKCVEAFEQYLTDLKHEKFGKSQDKSDYSAKFLLDRAKQEKRHEDWSS